MSTQESLAKQVRGSGQEVHLVVGYHADGSGRDAVELAKDLSTGRRSVVHLAEVLPEEGPNRNAYSPDTQFNAHLEAQARMGLEQAARVFAQPVCIHVVRAGSTAEGLIQLAESVGASLIVIGAAGPALVNRFALSTVATALLHSAQTPVALTPKGYRAMGGISRITCATGTREGASSVLEVSAQAAAARNIELRVISLVGLAGEAGAHDPAAAAFEHANELASHVRSQVVAPPMVSVGIGQGSGIEEAVEKLGFTHDEIVLVGSSRLARKHKLFLGTVAHKMLRRLSVPMVVVPRTFTVSGLFHRRNNSGE